MPKTLSQGSTKTTSHCTLGYKCPETGWERDPKGHKLASGQHSSWNAQCIPDPATQAWAKALEKGKEAIKAAEVALSTK